jgi:hypothetical protein
VIGSLAAATGSGSGTQDFARILMPLLGLAVFVVVAWVLIAAIRKRLRSPAAHPSASFTLEELRTMRSDGLLSEVEYMRARDMLTGGSRQKSQLPTPNDNIPEQ